MADGTLLFKTAIDESGLVKGLNGVKGAAHTAFGVSAKAAKAMTAAVTAGAGAVSALSVSAVKSYAEYEQLVGGVETLFKDSNNIVMEYAANAYETAGMSANSYMETVTSFSASLLQGLGGDTKQAAEIANLAVTDMSDNANKMGTDISSIQDAYQGFAKQNYTMLDNLKLGYGGTQTEMIRLINDSGILEEKIDSLDNITFDQMIQAIHAVQTDMGITGTTALEASTTIEGSVNSAKAAWSNLVTGIADDNQNFDELVNNFVNSVAIAADNLLPRIEIAINGIGTLIETLLPIIVNRIPIILNGVLPDLIQAGINMINSLVEGVEQNLPQIMNAGVSILSSLIDGIITCIPLLGSLAYNVITTLLEGIASDSPRVMESGAQMLADFMNGIGDKLPELIPLALDAILTFAQSIVDNLPTIVQAGLDMLVSLAKGVANALPTLIEKVPKIINSFCESLYAMLPKILLAGGKIIIELGKGIIKSIPTIIANAGEIVEAIFNVIALCNLFEAGKKIIASLGKGLENATGNIFQTIKDTVKKIVQNFKDTDWVSVGSDIIKGVVNGIKGAAGNLLQAAEDAAKGAIDAMKKKLGIHSPSRVAKKEVGKQLPDGAAEGVEENKGSMIEAAEEAAKETIGAMKGVLSTKIFSPEISLSNGIKSNIQNSIGTIQANLKGTGTTMKTQQGIDYNRMGQAMAYAMERSGFKLTIGQREFGRIVREVMA